MPGMVGMGKPRGDGWVGYPVPRPAAAVRLFCLPYAGGGASAFQDWPAGLPGVVEVAAVHLPGREGRFAEPPIDRMGVLVEVLADALPPHLDRPFAFFGHSMGARVGFELARELRRRGARGPVRLFVSGCRAPQLPPDPPTFDLPDDQLVARLRELGGTPPEVFAQPELVELLLPTVRADLTAVETVRFSPGPPLDCPIRAFGGSHDPEATPEETAAWEAQTRAGFTLQVLPGDHFFLHDQRDALLTTVAADLEADTAARAG